MNADEIVKALRDAAQDNDNACGYDYENCDECPKSELCIFTKLAGNAADLIESLQAEVDEYHAWQKGKIGVEEYLTLKQQYADLLERFAESQRREMAAVADMKNMSKGGYDLCDVCTKKCYSYAKQCGNFDWRGAQEDEK